MGAAGQIEWAGGVDIAAFAADVALFEEAIERVDFDLLAGLDDRGAQTLLRMVDQKDLVTALKGAAEPVRERFLRNMSARVGVLSGRRSSCRRPSRIIASRCDGEY